MRNGTISSRRSLSSASSSSSTATLVLSCLAHYHLAIYLSIEPSSTQLSIYLLSTNWRCVLYRSPPWPQMLSTCLVRGLLVLVASDRSSKGEDLSITATDLIWFSTRIIFIIAPCIYGHTEESDIPDRPLPLISMAIQCYASGSVHRNVRFICKSTVNTYITSLCTPETRSINRV